MAYGQRVPSIEGADAPDICYAREIRQYAVHSLANLLAVILVVGSKWRAVFGRSRAIGRDLQKPSYLTETSVQGSIAQLRRFGVADVSILAGVTEDVKFKFPAETH